MKQGKIMLRNVSHDAAAMCMMAATYKQSHPEKADAPVELILDNLLIAARIKAAAEATALNFYRRDVGEFIKPQTEGELRHLIAAQVSGLIKLANDLGLFSDFYLTFTELETSSAENNQWDEVIG